MKFLYIALMFIFISHNTLAGTNFEAGVNVEEKAQNSVIAKKNALNKAYREAFLKVASNVTSENNLQELNKLTDEQLLHFIREVEVVAEKSTSDSYMADLNVKINENLLEQYLSENDMLGTDTTVSKVLIIPTFTDTDYKDKVLFEDGNVWRLAWLEKGYIKSGSLNFETIKDDKANKSLLNPENLNNLDKDTYEKLFFLNITKNIFIVNAIRAGGNTLVVSIKSYPKNFQKSFVVNSDNYFDDAIEQTIYNITAFMQNQIETDVASNGKINITANLKLKDWLLVEQKLNNILQIKNIKLNSMSTQETNFTIEFSSNINSLIEDMAKNGLYLHINNDHYTLKI